MPLRAEPRKTACGKRSQTAFVARRVFVLAVGLLGAVVVASAAARDQKVLSKDEAQSHSVQQLSITVQDENGVPIPSAHVFIEQPETPATLTCETDYAGRCQFSQLRGGTYQLRAEKEGFYAVSENGIEVGKVESVQVTLNHQRESVEHVEVTYSPPAIDLKKTTSSTQLSSREIIELPYTVSRDIRYALPMLPGVLQDGTGQVHVAGSDTRQTYDQLDGFNINAPFSGLFTLRVSVDAIRAVEVQTSRYPAEFGKGSGGILSLRTGMGDDRFRFSATDIIPSLQNRKGLHINTWTPRAGLSGPLKKGKAWFLLAPEGEYDVDIIQELPPGADRSSAVRYGNLAKAQVNLTDGNILTASYVINRFRAYHAGLSRFDPLETTLNLRQAADLFTLKDQITLSNGGLLEFGVAKSRFRSAFHPRGDAAYVITPEQTSGNYFETGEGRSSRLQGIINWFLPPVRWNGRHEIKLGADLDGITFRQSFRRNPFQILREDGTLSREVTFSPISPFGRNNFEMSGYAQDRWSVSDRWVVEPGARFDWDQIVRDVLISPRLAASFLARRDGNTKLTAGIGLYNDLSNLDFITRPFGGHRTDFFFDATGQTLALPPVDTAFRIDDRILKTTRFLNWSVGLEHKLPHAVYLRTEFLEKRGRDGWTFVNPAAGAPATLGGIFDLRTSKEDRYDSLEVAARKSLANGHFVFASYTRSSARSNAVLDFALENPVFSRQAGGPLPWDSPNRFISWGWLPLRREYNVGYWLEWRGGYPFSLADQNQQIVGAPGSERFPTYFSLNVSVERRLVVFGFQWALRVGFDDITNRQNPTVVNNNVDSPGFLTFGGLQGRSLVARLRLLGEK